MLPAITTPPSGTPITPEQASIIAGTQELMNNPPEVDLPFGNTIARTLNGSLTYLRAGETGNVNLSGVSETLLEDEIAITKNGASVFGAFDNNALQSENLDDASWSVLNLDTPVQDGTLGPDLVTQAWRINRTIPSNLSVLSQTISVIDGDDQSAWFYIKGVAGETLKVECRATNNSVVSQKQHTLSGEWERLSSLTGVDWSASTGNIYCRIRFDLINTASTIYMTMAQQTNSLVEKPYKKTTTAPATRGADMASIPMMNNMPAAGNPFTIVLDASSATDGNNYAYYSSGNVVTTSGFAMRKNFTAGGILFFMSDGVSVVNVLSASLDGQPHKIVMVYDGNLIIMYIDGLEVKRATQGYAVYDVTDQLDFGARAGSQYLNSEIKNFEIYHVALSSDAVLALGAAS